MVKAMNTDNSIDPTPTQDDANHVLASTGNGGYAPDAFTAQLIEAWFKADSRSQMLIRAGWPTLGEALRMFTHDVDGVARLKAIASQHPTEQTVIAGVPTDAPTGRPARGRGWGGVWGVSGSPDTHCAVCCDDAMDDSGDES